MADISALIRDTPPVARALAGATLVISFSAHILGILSPGLLVYAPSLAFDYNGPQIWRLVTSFLLSSPRLGVLMDPFFLYKYASDCERVRLARKGDFIVFLGFVGSVILLLNTFVFGGMTFCSPLILALAYYWTAFEDPFSRVNFFIATFPVKFLPWLMLLLTLVQGGDVLLDLSGIIASHAFVFLTEVWPRHGGGHNYLKGSADLIERWFASTPSGPRPPPPRAVPAAGAVRVGGNEGATGSVFGARGAGWSHRGQGQRLGG